MKSIDNIERTLIYEKRLKFLKSIQNGKESKKYAFNALVNLEKRIIQLKRKGQDNER